MTLRFARPEDAAALLEIYRPYVEQTTISFETEVPSMAEFTGRIKDYAARFPYLVAEEDGTLLGYAYAHPFHERAAFGWTVESSVYVRQDVRGRHVGTMLYTALLRLLEALGVRNVCAVVTVPNEPSMAFHHALGFLDGGILPDFGYKLDKWCGVAYLYRRLGPTDPPQEPPLSIYALPPERIRQILREAGGIS